MIKQAFLESLNNYVSNSEQPLNMWNEVERNYTRYERHYHNLSHLNSLLTELEMYKSKFSNWDAIVFAIAYHDLVYNVLKSDNEERSARIAIKRLSTISFPLKLTIFCGQLIRATKRHESGDLETNLFTDADLSILGSDLPTYEAYSKQIRSEYSIYPEILYNPGRKKVLTHFLKMSNIYKTKEFSDRYELAARTNIQTELSSLINGTNEFSE
jgi:predicted metal-dependent HD superfamily phosphohydrolase